MYNIKVEIYDKIIQRIKNIKDILNYFPNFKKVNGVYIDNFENIINKIQKYLFDYYETLNEFEYSIIHGDTNFSNILIEPNNKDIKFIDPRGYFSNSEIYGLTDYDYAKILYGISGYDNFNNHHFIIESINENEINFKINKINVSDEFINNNFNKIHKILVVIIWIGLADYNKNNIWKCIASYYHGLYLGTLLDL
jgi:thiamine kinase-like enzyme